ncbi:MAG: hypothetical protein Q4D23_11060 [Bacteroidales bacterium]|nr:hypothetical protein [Bacteroidales bacterium]
MTKQEMLQQFTKEELKEELRRRNIAKRKEKEGVPRCRNCKRYGTIGYYGGEPNGRTDCCPLMKVKSGKHYRVMNPSSLACKHYIQKDEQ